MIEGGALGLLWLAPLPYGAVPSWAEALVEMIVAALVALTLLRLLAGGEITVHRTPLLGPAVAMIAVGLAQLLLPPWALGSANRWATWVSMRLYLAYAGLLLVLGFILTTRQRVARLAAALTLCGAASAVVGLAGRLAGRSVVPWAVPAMDSPRLTATLISPNHQALYLAILLFVALGLVVRPGRTGTRPSTAEAPSLRPAATRVASWLRRAGLMGALTVMGLALVLTLSRGGLLGLGAGLAVVLILSLGARTGGLSVLVASGAVGAVVLWLGGNPMLHRLQAAGADPFADIRWLVYDRTVAMAGERPVLGFGLGSFADAFTRFQPPGVPVGKIVDHAHNDYLQLAAETGVAGLVVLLWALLALLTFSIGRFRRRHDPFVRGLGMGGLGALAAVMVHSALDFGLRVPAVALTTVAAMALLVNGLALRTHHGSGGGLDLPAWSWRVTGHRRTGALVGLAAAAAVAGMVLVPAVRAGLATSRADRLAGPRVRDSGQVTMADLIAARRQLVEAARLEPANPGGQERLATVSSEIAVRTLVYGLGPDGRLLGPELATRLTAGQPYLAGALEAYRRALAGNPLSAMLHERYAGFLVMLDGVGQRVRGSARLRVDDPSLARALEGSGSLLAEAQRHYQEAVELDPMNAARNLNLGVFALSRLPEREGLALATASFRRALDLDPRLLPAVLDRLGARETSRAILAEALPPRDDVWLQLATLLERQRRFEDAGWSYQRALEYAPGPAGQAQVRLAYGRFLLARGQAREALEQARLTLVLEPRSDQVHVLMAGIYETLGQIPDALAALASAASAAGEKAPELARTYREEIAELHLRHGNLDQAISVHRALVEETPDSPVAHLKLGALYRRAHRWVEAEREFQTVLTLDAANTGAVRSLALMRVDQGRTGEAAALLERAVASRPNERDLRLTLAGVYEQLSKPVQAAEQYRDVLSRHPSDAEARRRLAALGVAAGGSTRP